MNRGKMELVGALTLLIMLRILYIILLIAVACLLMVTLLEYFLHYFNPTLDTLTLFLNRTIRSETFVFPFISN